jgi:HEPN domain-containing protein
MTEIDHAKEWFSFARHDLMTARFLLGMIPVPFEIVCFHCQQAAEKAVIYSFIKDLFNIKE